MLTSQTLLHYTTMYRSGNPFPTDAVIVDIPTEQFLPANSLKYFNAQRCEGKTVLQYQMRKQDKVYGLGEQLGGLNRRGRVYKTFNTDIAPHMPHLESLYGSHPFLFIAGEQGFGLFIDYPSEITFDIGHAHKDVLEILIPSEDFDLYLFDVASPKLIIQEYLTLTGAPYIPPKWAFGYQQCRYSYPDAKTVLDVAEKFRALDIPCDAIGMDIDYMVAYKVFTLDEEKFPKFPQFVQRMKNDGFRLVPILDAGVKIENGYAAYDEGKAKGYFCVEEDGSDFVAAVWPGLCHFPDFLRPDVREWWGQLYKIFTDAGIEGFWNDMNEPAIFYVPEVLKQVRDKMYAVFSKEELGHELIHTFGDITSMFNRRDYYRRFFHRQANDELINHEDIHNLYAFNMTRGTAEQLEKIMPEKRYFLLSRGSYAGLHRFSGIWTGDNSSWWEHLPVNMQMLMSLNLNGFFYIGADIGGFGQEPSPELVIRWMQLGIFSPLFRNHTWFGARNQEPWSFDEESTAILRNVLRLRYALLPYSYSEFMQAAKTLEPFIAPLFMEFGGERAHQIEDQYLYGKSVMVAPVYTPNARGRFVHLPECRWLYWQAAACEQRDMRVMAPGDYFVEADLQEIPVFLRENHLMPIAEPVKYVDERVTEHLTLVGLVTDRTEYTFYEDDGETYGYRDGQYGTVTITIAPHNGDYRIDCRKDERAGYALHLKEITFELYDADGHVSRTSMVV